AGPISDKHLEQPDLGLGRDDRDRLEESLRIGAEPSRPREHGIPNRFGDALSAGCERLDDEEWVAARLAVQILRINVMRLGQQSHRICGERCELQTAEYATRGEITQKHAQRMG